MSELFDKGLKVRKEVLGEDYVNKSIAGADEFTRTMAEWSTEFCWGALWTRPGMDRRTRSIVNLAMLGALNRPHELKLHVKGALKNGVTKEEIKEILLQVAVYCGVPAGIDAFRNAREALNEAEFEVVNPAASGSRMAEPEYELFAIRYATREARRGDHFIGGDPHDGPMPMDYFMWVAKGGGRTFVIDTGFNAEVSNKRKRTFLRCPVETLSAFDIDVNAVEDVILTHLHYDHAGNFDRFPNARFHLQERELAYATGRFMRYPRLSHSFEVEDICGIVRLNYARRVMFYNGDAELAPGLTVHAAGGHSAGLQFVRVKTRRGFVVLASDVSHFYENMASERPFTTALHIGEMLEGFEKLLALAPDESHIVPGHDPLVMKLYPAPSPALEGIAVRLDVPPSGAAPVRADFLRGH